MGIVADAKEIAELIKKYNDQELYERIVNLRDEILDLREDNILLKETVKNLEVSLQTDRQLVRKGNVYLLKDDVENERIEDVDTPWFCMSCWDYDRKLVNVYKCDGGLKCNICSARNNNS
tara:strand:+ start:1812 stop:2171 length:360 start_codon:yes stop_codon:yes gene_type:complete